MHAAGGGTGNSAGRPTAKEEDAHARINQVHPCALCGAPQGTAPCGNMARQVIDALPKREKEEELSMMPMAPAN